MLSSLRGDHYAQVQATADASHLRLFTHQTCTGRFSHPKALQCLLWLDLPSSDKRQKKRTRTDDAKEALASGGGGGGQQKAALAVGSADGHLFLLDPKGAILKKFSATSRPVRALSAHQGLLWAALDDGSLSAWTLPLADGSGGALYGVLKAHQDAFCALMVLPMPAGLEALNEDDSAADADMSGASKASTTTTNVLIIAASNTLTLLTAALPTSPKPGPPLPFRTLATSKAGHTASITSISTLSSSPLRIATTSTTDRFLNIWAFDAGSADLSLKAQLALQSPILRSLAASDVVAAVTKQGELAVARYAPAPLKKKRVQPLRPAYLVQGDVVDVALGKEGWKVVRGAIKPVFQDLALDMDALPSEPQTIELEALNAKAVNFQEGEDVDMGAPSQRIKSTSKKDAAASASAPVTSLEQEDALMEPVNPGDLAVDASEPTLADRLKALQVQKPAGEREADPVPVPTASLTSALIQALHSADAKLLESCLVHSKSPIVNATVKRLPTHLVVPLVDALVERLARGRRGYGAGEASAHATRARALTAWLKCVLVVHIAHLISVPGLVGRLSSLYKTIQARLELQEPLLALSGRLDLVVSQIELRREAAMVKAARTEETVDYVEGQSDSDDEEPAEVEDVVIQPTQEVSDSEEEEEDSEDDGDETAVSGFLDLEAEESDGEDDEDFEGLEEEESASDDSGSGSDDD